MFPTHANQTKLDRRMKEVKEEIRCIVKKNRDDNFLIEFGLSLDRYSVEGGDDDQRFLLDHVTGKRYQVSTSASRDQVRAVVAAQD